MKEVKKINIWELIILLMPIIDIFNTITNKSLSLYFRLIVNIKRYRLVYLLLLDYFQGFIYYIIILLMGYII